jgi:UPF0755 protein
MKISKENLRGVSGLVMALLIIALMREVKPNVSSAADFPCGSGGSEVMISIASGESGSSIANRLYSLEVVRSSAAFFRVAVGDERSASIAPGNHRIESGICAKQALEQLLDNSRITNLLAINEGAWNSEIGDKLVGLGFSEKKVESALASFVLPDGYSSLEGLLFPAQYSFDTSTSLAKILDTLVDRGVREIERAGISQPKDGFTAQELLIIASLAEAEGGAADYRKVSQVVRNRLSLHMPLQFDSTVHYIMGKRGSIFLSTKSTLLNSPFNTYQNRGLPPRPINNPGFLAMQAAGNPAPGKWLYFITVAPGDTRFTDSFSQFSEWKLIYKKNLREGKFK